MAYKKKHIKNLNPELWEKIKQVTYQFPLALTESEYEGDYSIMKDYGSSGTFTFKSGTAIADVMNHKVYSIPVKIDHILEKHLSIGAYLKDEYENRQKNYDSYELISKQGKLVVSHAKHKLFDRVPIQKLKEPKYSMPSHVEVYTRRRTMFSLLKICMELNPKLFNSNKKFKEALLQEPQSKNSNFYRAIRIEPCLLQTEIGSEIIQGMSLWDKKNVEGLGIALRPKGKTKIDSTFETSKHTSLIQMILLILKAIEPKVTKLKDRELIDLLKESGHYPKNYEPESFQKLRKSLFSK